MKQLHDDLLAAPVRERVFVRYFTFTHLHNGGLAEVELHNHRFALAKTLNSLSWQRRIAVPRAVDSAGTVLRIDLRDYGWNEKTWEQIVNAYPFGLLYGTSDEKAAVEMTKTKFPAVRGDWFVFVASRPPLYHELLELPQTERELEKLLQVNTAETIRVERIARAGFNSSGVAQHNRLIERHESTYGSYWRSFDFKSSIGRQNLFDNPLGPGRGKKDFDHDASEIIFSLPNGLQGYMLVDFQGKRLDRAAAELVSDSWQKDKTVVNGISCMRCHAGGIIAKVDQIRLHVKDNAKAFDDNERATVLALNPENEKFQTLVAEDAFRFRHAVNLTVGKTPASALADHEPIAAVAFQFEQELALAAVAAETNVSTGELVKAIQETPSLARVFGPLTIPGNTVQRQVLIVHFKDLSKSLSQGTYVAPGRVLASDEDRNAQQVAQGPGSSAPSSVLRPLGKGASNSSARFWVAGTVGLLLLGGIGVGVKVATASK